MDLGCQISDCRGPKSSRNPTSDIRHPILWSCNPALSFRIARFRLFRVRSPLLSQSRFLSFPPGTEMVHFPGFARTRLWIRQAVRGFYPRGFPHSEISGSKPACGSPKLIAACHVFHRRLLPRHPPCALSSLTIKFTRHTPDRSGTRRANLTSPACSSHAYSIARVTYTSRH